MKLVLHHLLLHKISEDGLDSVCVEIQVGVKRFPYVVEEDQLRLGEVERDFLISVLSEDRFEMSGHQSNRYRME